MTVAPGGGLGDCWRAARGPNASVPSAELRRGRPTGRCWRSSCSRHDQAGPPAIAILTARGALVRRVAVPGSYDAHPVGLAARRAAARRDDRRPLFTVAAAGGPARAVAGLRGARAWSVRGDVAIAHRRGIYVRPAGTGRQPADPAREHAPPVRRARLVAGRSPARRATHGHDDRPVDDRHGRARGAGAHASWSAAPRRAAWSAIRSGRRPARASRSPRPASTRRVTTRRRSTPSGRTERDLRRLFEPISLTGRLGGVEAYVSSALSWQAQP